MVGLSVSVNLPLHHKAQKFSSGTASREWSPIKGRKMVVIGEGGCIAVVCKVVCYKEVRPGLSGKKLRWHFSQQR